MPYGYPALPSPPAAPKYGPPLMAPNNSYTMPNLSGGASGMVFSLPEDKSRMPGPYQPRGPQGSPIQYVDPNPYAGMGYGAPNTGLYGGAATPVNVGMVGGYQYAPGAQQSMNRRMAEWGAKEYQRAFNEARQANEARYGELVGTSAGAATGRANGKELLKIGGKWVPRDKVDASQINSEVAKNSLTAPALGGYYGRYARGQNQLDQMGGLANQYDQRLTRNLGYVDQMGQQERKDIETDATNQLAQQQSNLASRGLSNSTIQASIANEVNKQKQAQMGRLNDRMLGTKLQTDMAASGDALQFRDQYGRLRLASDAALSGDLMQLIERRNDTYPDLSPFMQAQQQYGGYGGYR
jgi:hypothetical protein